MTFEKFMETGNLVVMHVRVTQHLMLSSVNRKKLMLNWKAFEKALVHFSEFTIIGLN